VAFDASVSRSTVRGTIAGTIDLQGVGGRPVLARNPPDAAGCLRGSCGGRPWSARADLAAAKASPAQAAMLESLFEWFVWWSMAKDDEFWDMLVSAVD